MAQSRFSLVVVECVGHFPRPVPRNSVTIGCGSPQVTCEDNAAVCRWQAEPTQAGSLGSFGAWEFTGSVWVGRGAGLLEWLRATLTHFLPVPAGQESGQSLQSRRQAAVLLSAGPAGRSPPPVSCRMLAEFISSRLLELRSQLPETHLQVPAGSLTVGQARLAGGFVEARRRGSISQRSANMGPDIFHRCPWPAKT